VEDTPTLETKHFQDKVYQIKDSMAVGVEIILQELQTMLQAAAVVLVVLGEIIVKDLLGEEVAMDLPVLFLDL
jgi:hypothetical protein